MGFFKLFKQKGDTLVHEMKDVELWFGIFFMLK